MPLISLDRGNIIVTLLAIQKEWEKEYSDGRKKVHLIHTKNKKKIPFIVILLSADLG
jgi:hypothetical protein